jgi:hypothetical protein
VPLARGENGVCEVIVEESDDIVLVRVLVCLDEKADALPPAREFMTCPVRRWLDRPLGNRKVVDVDSNEALPLFSPKYRTYPSTADAGAPASAS